MASVILLRMGAGVFGQRYIDFVSAGPTLSAAVSRSSTFQQRQGIPGSLGCVWHSASLFLCRAGPRSHAELSRQPLNDARCCSGSSRVHPSPHHPPLSSPSSDGSPPPNSRILLQRCPRSEPSLPKKTRWWWGARVVRRSWRAAAVAFAAASPL